MIDYTASLIARMEHEERVRSMTPVYDYDEWLTDNAGHWQLPRFGSLWSALGKGIASLGVRLKNTADVETPAIVTRQEQESAAS